MEQTTGNLSDIVLQCNDISKEFDSFDNSGKNQVLSHIDLSVKKNEFLVLFGPGQCGKTTLLNILAGLELPTSGTVSDHQKPVTAPAPQRGVVYQRTALFPWLTVMGNVEFGPKMRGMGKKERREIANYYIDLGIARAYCNNPDILLMDEPFGHLDAQTRYMMEDELQRIWQKDKRTVVFVTNNIEEALFLADRIVLMTNCPSTIKEEYNITLPHPRSYVDPEFLRLRKMITENTDKSR